MKQKQNDEYLYEIFAHEEHLIKLINELSENQIMNYLKKNKERILNSFYKYDSKLTPYIFFALEQQYSQKHHSKLIETQCNTITQESENFLKQLISSNKIIINKRKLLKILLKIKKSIIILNNMIYSYKDYKLEIDYTKYESIPYKHLEIGDIILTIKTDKIINKRPINKLIYFITKSHIIHSTMYLGKEKGKFLFLDVSTVHYFGKTKYKKYKMDYTKNQIGLVLRKKGGLNTNEKEKLNQYLTQYIGYEYGTYKALLLALKLAIYKINPKYKNLDNQIFTQTSYCSENVTRIYEEIGIYLGNKEDEATITPVDLLNSKHLEIIGYINKPQKEEKTK